MSKTDIYIRIRELQQELIRLSLSRPGQRACRADHIFREITINRQKLKVLS